MFIGALAQYFFGFTIFVLSLFLVLLVLVQRGRGGGLTGALGGPGGQSAFGTKAGDLFTRITVGVATAWIILCAASVYVLRGKGLPETGVVNRPSTTMKSGADAGESKVPAEPATGQSAAPTGPGAATAPVIAPGAATTPAPAAATPTPAAATDTATTPAVDTPAPTTPTEAPVAPSATEPPAAPVTAEVTEVPPATPPAEPDKN